MQFYMEKGAEKDLGVGSGSGKGDNLGKGLCASSFNSSRISSNIARHPTGEPRLRAE